MSLLIFSLFVGCKSATPDELADVEVTPIALGDEAPEDSVVYELDADADPWLGFTAWGRGNSEQHGTWSAYNVRLTRAEDGAWSIDFVCEMDSVETGNSMLTNHLKTTDFFDTASFPEGRFASTEVVDHGDGTWTVTGDMTLRGTTQQIEFDAVVEVDEDVHTTATIEFSRWDFGLYPEDASEPEADGVADEVVVDFDVTLTTP